MIFVVTSPSRAKNINDLSNLEAAAILKYMTEVIKAEMSQNPMPQRENEQREAISALLKNQGYEVDLKRQVPELQIDQNTMGRAAKELLLQVAKTENGNLLNELDAYLADPPKERTAGIDPTSLVLFFPIVIAGCIALLNISGGVAYDRENGLTINRDPGSKARVRENLDVFSNILKKLRFSTAKS